jgi:hypothetical protein
MSKIVNLPSGETATLRDPKSLKQKDRAKLYEVDVDGSVKSGMAMMDRLVATLIEEWSFDLILPSIKLEMLGELSIADYDALSAEAEGAMGVLFPSLAKTEAAEADPKAPTAKSND